MKISKKLGAYSVEIDTRTKDVKATCKEPFSCQGGEVFIDRVKVLTFNIHGKGWLISEAPGGRRYLEKGGEVNMILYLLNTKTKKMIYILL